MNHQTRTTAWHRPAAPVAVGGSISDGEEPLPPGSLTLSAAILSTVVGVSRGRGAADFAAVPDAGECWHDVSAVDFLMQNPVYSFALTNTFNEPGPLYFASRV